MRSRAALSFVALSCLVASCTRAGEWQETPERSGGDSSPNTTRFPAESCGPLRVRLATERPKILLLLDRSASMLDPPQGEASSATENTSKWDLVVPALTEVITRSDASVDWGMKSFPEGDQGTECGSDSVTSRIDVPIAASNAQRVTAQIELTTAEGAGTPTGDAVRSALTYLLTLPQTAAKFLILATDGEPSCAGTVKGQETARPYAIEALTEALDHGIPTFVVGVATNKESATQVLNALAVAGGQARAVDEPDTRYFLGNTQDELLGALLEITENVAGSCSVPLPSAPTNPELATLRISGTEVPRDPTHQEGWDFVTSDRIETFGTACERARKAAPDGLEIVYGCVQALP